MKDERVKSPSPPAVTPGAPAVTPGKIGAGQLSSNGIRPRSPSVTDEITRPVPNISTVKGVAPRAPSVSRPEITEVTIDPRTLATTAAKDAAKELIEPLQARIAELETRLAKLETDEKDRVAAAAAVAAKAAASRVPAPPVFADAFITAPPSRAPSPSYSSVPTITSAAPVVSSTSATAIVAAPASVPPPSIVQSAHIAQVVQETHLSDEELKMFNGGKRQRRVITYFVLLIVLLGGALAASAIISRS